jgi:ring-1,2-phenylacetyl-CoA epoxidase subunit PaaD
VVTRAQRAWDVLANVPDPEVPALSVRDLGIVRDVIDHGAELEVVLTPTYSGCPATEVIEQNVLQAIAAEGLGPARATLRRAPAWTTDWISDEGKRKLREYGIAPPRHVTAAEAGAQGARIHIFRRKPETIPCPRCGSASTQQLSAFGSTACKSLHRCLACREPFEYFKPL